MTESISVWPNVMEPETEDEIKGENFHLEKKLPETFPYHNNDLQMHRILNFRKARYVPAVAIA
jgi:hypothetical protein